MYHIKGLHLLCPPDSLISEPLTLTRAFFQLTLARLQALAVTVVGFWSLLGHPR